MRALTKDEILQSYISDHDFRSSNVRAVDNGYYLCIFDIRYQKLTAAQPIKVAVKFDGIVPNDINGSA